MAFTVYTVIEYTKGIGGLAVNHLKDSTYFSEAGLPEEDRGKVQAGDLIWRNSDGTFERMNLPRWEASCHE